jgi:transcriptional regulator with XRE-family HTH domain
MDDTVRVLIERAKAAAGVVTDEELGKKLGCSKQAIASWRRRGSVPSSARAKILNMTLEKSLPSISELEEALALQKLQLKHTTAIVRAETLVNALTISFWSTFISSLKNPPSPGTMLSIARAQKELASIVRLTVLPVFEDGDEETLFRFANKHHALKRDAHVCRLLESLDLEGNEVSAK